MKKRTAIENIFEEGIMEQDKKCPCLSGDWLVCALHKEQMTKEDPCGNKGWLNMYNVDEEREEIQRCDFCHRFSGDDEAIRAFNTYYEK